MRQSRRLSILLIASLGVNLFLAGMLAAQWFAQERTAMVGPFNRHAASAALSEEYRPVVQSIWDESEGVNRDHLYRARQYRNEIRQHLTTEAYDRAALERSFEGLRDTMVPLGTGIFMTIAEIAEALPPDERRRYFETGFAAGRPMPQGPYGDGSSGRTVPSTSGSGGGES